MSHDPVTLQGPPVERRNCSDEIGIPPLVDDLVTVVIPARDEESFIGRCLDAVSAQDEPNLQILVVDGRSRDRTREIVLRRAEQDPRIELVDNPEQIVPTGLNAALARTRGRFLVRIDAHATVPTDYVRRAVTHLRTGQWGGVGGRKDGVGRTAAGRAVAAVMASRFGVGGSTYHHGTTPRTVEHIPFGAYPTQLVRDLGGWDERLAVNQDFEFDYRVRRSGFKVLFDPALVIDWYCRQSIGELYRQYRRYGTGKVRVALLHPGSLRPRHLAAPVLVAWLAGAAALAPARPRIAAAAVAPYVVGLSIGTAVTARPLEKGARRYVPAAFVAMHVGWGIGFWRGVGHAIVGGQRGGREAAVAKPRVLIVAQAAPAQGGIASFAAGILNDQDLARFIDVRLLNTTRREIRRAGTLSVENLRNTLVDALRVYRQSRRYDVVHIQTALVPTLPLLRALALCAAARLGGAFALCHVHSGRLNSGRAEAFDPNPVTKWLLRRLRIANGILTCADHGTATLRHLVPGVPVETVDNAVDVSAFRPADHRDDPEPVTLLFLGTLSRRKGVLDLLSALVLLRERTLRPWRIKVVGGAAEAGEAEAGDLRAAFADAGFQDALVGSLSGERLRDQLSTAGVFVLPSHWEGQPIAILEAMAAGLPIVATAVGAVPQVVRDGVEGIIIEPHRPADLADALERLIADPELRARLGSAARRRVESHHDIPNLSHRLREIYQRAASR